MGDSAGAVLAGSAIGVAIVAGSVAIVDTVPDCRDSGGGVSCADKNYSVSAGEDTGASREKIEHERRRRMDEGRQRDVIF